MKQSMKLVKIRIPLLGILLFANFSLIAQNDRIDSLKKQLLITPKAESFEPVFDLAREYLDINNRLSLEYAKKANAIAKDSLCVIKSLRLVAQAHRRLNNLDSSIYYYKKCFPLATSRHDYEEMNNVLNGMGIVFNHQAKYDQALRCHLEALDLPLHKTIRSESIYPYSTWVSSITN